jgi:uncharacterized protein YkwD
VKAVGPLCALLPLLAACVDARPPPAPPPAIYASLAAADARLDAETARDLINAYRLNAGLPRLALDPALMREAARQADAMAAGGDVSRGARTDILARLKASGVAAAQARESVSAGYFTLSDAFSGWRGSPTHDATLTLRRGGRLGIAARHRAGSRHHVYWALIVAE